MNIQWYPGHMTKAKRMMQEDIKLIDIVIELLDARAPLSSKNPDIDQLAGQKFRLILLNKCDLADPSKTKLWERYFQEMGYFVVCLDSRKNAGMKVVTDTIKAACKQKIERDRKRGIINRPLRGMVVGIPNVGKSTFINSYAKKACAKVGNKPGVTKGKQWIRLGEGVELLDTPGILWPKFEDREVGIRLAYIGSINDTIIEKRELAYSFVNYLKNNYCNAMADRYNIDESKNHFDILSDIAINRCCMQKGSEPDLDKASAILFDDFRSGRLGRITLELP
ncbi:MAG: ribosome biogenesis GTPase YlqF [Eubacteriales bacterium]|nr:ribosome biogenesis GTPase YlqF [Eubacteriales bacterium]